MTKQQTRVVEALRKGIAGVLDGVPDNNRDQKLVTNKAVDVETLLEVIDAQAAMIVDLKTKVPPTPPADPAPPADGE